MLSAATPAAPLLALSTGDEIANSDAHYEQSVAPQGRARPIVNVRHLPIDRVVANPDQPRQHFDADALAELAASIREHGLMQPIVVTERGDGTYMIVGGERRWRAHLLLGAATILAKIEAPLSDRDVLLRAIVENAARRDVTPLEEAHAYQRCIAMGMSVDELAESLGVSQPWRIADRLALLALRPEYQTLLRGGSLTVTQAQQMATLDPPGQDTLFRAIKAGECVTADALRIRAAELRAAQQQSMFGFDVAAPAVSEADRKRAKAFERRVEQVAAMLRAGTVANEVVALRAVSPHKAGATADYITAMICDLARLERALRTHSATLLDDLVADAARAGVSSPAPNVPPSKRKAARPAITPTDRRRAAAHKAWITIRAKRAAAAAA